MKHSSKHVSIMDYSSNQRREAGSLLKTVFNFSHMSDKTQQHLTKVYTLLLVCAFVCALGMYTNATFIVSGFFMTLLSIILSVYLIYKVNDRSMREDSRMLFLAALAFQLGFLVGPAINHLTDVNPELVMQAVTYTGAAFTSFSLISLLSKRRSMLFVGGIIVCLIQGLFFYRIFGWLLGYSFYNMTYLMFGLLTACLYIIYDTQIIIEKAELGDQDVISHTLLLFVDLFDLFIRILKILIELQKNEDNKKKKDKK